MQISCCRSQDPSGRESCQLWKKHTQCFWKSLYFPILSYMLDFNSISFCQYQKLKALLPLFSSFNLKQIFYNHILEKEDAHHYPHSPFLLAFCHYQHYHITRKCPSCCYCCCWWPCCRCYCWLALILFLYLASTDFVVPPLLWDCFSSY